MLFLLKTINLNVFIININKILELIMFYITYETLFNTIIIKR